MADGTFSRRFDYEDRTKLTDSAYQEIKKALIDLRFKPGDILRESAIGAELGVSKTPVREALIKLEHDGLVHLIPFRGAQVTGYAVEDIREILDLRAILQSECVRRVATEQNDELIERLRRNVDESREASEDDDFRRMVSLFDDFDAIIMSQIENRRAMLLIGNLQDHMMRIGQLSTSIPGRFDRSIQQHGAIVDALAAGDADAAGSAMREHIESVLEDELSAIAADDVAGAIDTSPAKR